MSSKIILTRNQLAKFLPNPEAIKAFENLFKLATQLNPDDIALLTKLSEEASLDGNSALSFTHSVQNELTALTKKQKTITSNYEIPSTNATIFADCTSGAIIVTMPNPVTSIGKSFSITKIDTTSNIVTISPYSTELVAGNATQILVLNSECLDLMSDGINWQVGG